MAKRIPSNPTGVALAAAAVLLALAGCQSLVPPGRSPSGGDLGPALDASLRVLASPAGGAPGRAGASANQRALLAGHLPMLMEEAARPSGALGDLARDAIQDPQGFSAIDPIVRPEIGTPGLHREGLGLPAIGRIRPGGPNAPRAGFRVPVTLVALPPPPPAECCDAALVDPDRLAVVPTRYGRLPVAMDLETPLAATANTGPRLGTALVNLVRPGAFSGEPRIVFLEPFDQAKTPVVLVHGLLSTPRTWEPLVRALLADPGFRACCQPWFFYYPTGQPVPLSALQLREALDDAVAVHGPTKPLILIGHSMGGILSRTLVSRIGLDEADAIVPGVAALPSDSLIRRTLVFEPRDYVGRVVFMFVPHRGSRLATSGLGNLGIRLIRLPSNLLDEIGAAARYLTGVEGRRLPTSIHGLSPDSAFLAVLDATRPVVPVHTILGDRGRGDGWAGSDGVVPYSSAHLPAAASEVVVPTGHGGFGHPQAIVELLRIIRLALAEAAG